MPAGLTKFQRGLDPRRGPPFARGNRPTYPSPCLAWIAAADDPAELRALLVASFERNEGSTAAVARELHFHDMSHVHYYLRRFGLTRLPREIRARVRATFAA